MFACNFGSIPSQTKLCWEEVILMVTVPLVCINFKKEKKKKGRQHEIGKTTNNEKGTMSGRGEGEECLWPQPPETA